ncbi:MAG: hypothetical protein AAF957_05765 [Planctomycetota bacterium]
MIFAFLTALGAGTLTLGARAFHVAKTSLAESFGWFVLAGVLGLTGAIVAMFAYAGFIAATLKSVVEASR